MPEDEVARELQSKADKSDDSELKEISEEIQSSTDKKESDEEK